MGSDVSPPAAASPAPSTSPLATSPETSPLPPATITMYTLGTVAAADASFAIDPVGPTTGHVDFASSHVTTTSTFNIGSRRSPAPDPRGARRTVAHAERDLVGSDCRTSTPISVTMSGTVDFVHGGTFSGNFSIPKFHDCKAMTAAINAIIPGRRAGTPFRGHLLTARDPCRARTRSGTGRVWRAGRRCRPPSAPGAPAPHASTGITGHLPIDVAPGAGTTVGTRAARRLRRRRPAAGQAAQPKHGGLLGLLFGTG